MLAYDQVVKRLFRAALGLAAGAVAYGKLLRPRFKVWGATDEEHAATYPGDDLVPGARDRSTFAITIDAPPSAVWPWLVQMGTDRGGFYSWDSLDNGGNPSADRIHPEWQDLAEGGRIWTVPERAWFDVPLIEPERTLVLRASLKLASGTPFDPSGPPPPAYVDGVWSFHLRPQDGNKTRLIVRATGIGRPRALTEVGNFVFWDPAHWFMQTKQLEELKRRAETGSD